ncbi:MAG: 3-phosphoglycerate dehydrogenase [Spirochaeta sp.]|nr:3-phosphoglycerate dehydrogenase [Spirochaeta sp.]
MSYRVLIPQDVAEVGKKYLTDRGYELKMGSGITTDIIKEEVKDCDAILARIAGFPAEVIEAGPKLKVIGFHGVGVDKIDFKRAEELGIWVTNAPESNAGSVADDLIGMIIALARNFIFCDRELRSGNFGIRNQLKGVDLDGKTLGIVGLGRVGTRVAKKAKSGLNMKIIAFDPYTSQDRIGAEVELVADRDYLFREADFISLHLPATPETKNIVGRREFELMKATAYLINAARGEILAEGELVRALQERKIAGAALDVYEREPPETDNPLFALDNVILSPHNAALTRECMDRMALHAAMGIDEVLSG